MAEKFFEYQVSTKRGEEFINITSLVQKSIKESGVKDGLATVFCPHTTAGVTINENADPDVVRDMLAALDKVFPVIGDYRHFEGNSHAHLKASYVGSDTTIIIRGGVPVLGTWQGIYFCEFDGPRQRKVFIKIIEG